MSAEERPTIVVQIDDIGTYHKGFEFWVTPCRSVTSWDYCCRTDEWWEALASAKLTREFHRRGAIGMWAEFRYDAPNWNLSRLARNKADLLSDDYETT